MFGFFLAFDPKSIIYHQLIRIMERVIESLAS